jgi:chromosome segregation ATPase
VSTLKAQVAAAQQQVTQSRQETEAAQAATKAAQVALQTAQEHSASLEAGQGDLAALRKTHQQRVDSQRSEHEQMIKRLQAAEAATSQRQANEHKAAMEAAVVLARAEENSKIEALTQELNDLTISLASENSARAKAQDEAEASLKEAAAQTEQMSLMTAKVKKDAAARATLEAGLKALQLELEQAKSRVETLQSQLETTNSTHQNVVTTMQAKLEAATTTHQQAVAALETKLTSAEESARKELERQAQQAQTLSALEKEKRQTLAQLTTLREEKQSALANLAKQQEEHAQERATHETLLRDMATERDEALKDHAAAVSNAVQVQSPPPKPDAATAATLAALQAELTQAQAALAADTASLGPEVARLRQLLERHGLNPDQTLPETPPSSGSASLSASLSSSRPTTPNREDQRRAVDVLARVVGQRPDVSGQYYL